MKNYFLILFICSFSACASSQEEFSFTLYFEDGIGNLDSLIIGYDDLAMDTVDLVYNEVNIINQPLNTVFDIRITNEEKNRDFFGIDGTYHLKKNIIKKNCGSWFDILAIDILVQNWPVTIYWDSSLFFNTCRNGSVFTSVHPGGWWDTGGFRNAMVDSSSCKFNNNLYYYENNNGDSIATVWFTFADSTLLTADISETKMDDPIVIFPNPMSDYFSFENVSILNEIDELEIVNYLGEKVNYKIQGNRVYPQSLTPGIYIVKITFHDNNLSLLKVIKT